MLDLRPYLEGAGHEVEVICWAPTKRRQVVGGGLGLLRAARAADVVVLQRPNQPVRLIEALARVNPRIVVDFDDAIWISSEGGFAPRYGSRLIAAIRCSRAVVTGSSYLADWARGHARHGDVVVMRSPTRISATSREAERGDGPPVIVWIGNPVNFADFPAQLDEALGELVDLGRARFVVVSSEPMAAVPGAAFVAWSEQAQAEVLAQASIGIMPLRDDERSKGRCGFKAIQYMGAGLPVVASDVGVAPELVVDDVSGILVGDAGAWMDALSQMLDDAPSRERMGAQGRRWVEQNATHDRAASVLLEVLRKAVDD